MARKGLYSKTLTLPDGTRKYFYGKTKKEVNEKYEQAKADMKQGRNLKDRSTFGQFAQLWFDTCKRGKVQHNTEVGILGLINTNVMPVLSAKEMSKITPMDCAKVFTEMDRNGKASSTQNRTRNYMAQIFDSAVENGLIVKSPMTKSVRIGGRKNQKRMALSPEQVNELLTAVRGGKRNIEYYVRILLGTGLRKGELLGLHWEDVDMDACELTVRHNLVYEDGLPVLHSYTKTASGKRTIPFADDTRKAFQAMWLQRKGNLVFHEADGSPISITVEHWLFRHIKQASDEVAISPHILRHTCITNWFDMGLDVKEVQYLAGHATANMTLNVYTDYLSDKRYESTKAKIQCTTSVPHPVVQAVL